MFSIALSFQSRPPFRAQFHSSLSMPSPPAHLGYPTIENLSLFHCQAISPPCLFPALVTTNHLVTNLMLFEEGPSSTMDDPSRSYDFPTGASSWILPLDHPDPMDDPDSSSTPGSPLSERDQTPLLVVGSSRNGPVKQDVERPVNAACRKYGVVNFLVPGHYLL